NFPDSPDPLDGSDGTIGVTIPITSEPPSTFISYDLPYDRGPTVPPNEPDYQCQGNATEEDCERGDHGFLNGVMRTSGLENVNSMGQTMSLDLYWYVAVPDTVG